MKSYESSKKGDHFNREGDSGQGNQKRLHGLGQVLLLFFSFFSYKG